METIEGLLEFDLSILLQYADEIADERQKLTRFVVSTGQSLKG